MAERVQPSPNFKPTSDDSSAAPVTIPPAPSDPNNNESARSNDQAKKSDQLEPMTSEGSPVDLIALEAASHLILKHNFAKIDSEKCGEDALRYDVFDQTGNRIYILYEVTKSCKICFWKTDRPFLFVVLDHSGRRIFRIQRPCGCGCCCGVCLCGDMCFNKVLVTFEDGSAIGSVSQKFRCCAPTYSINNATGEPNFTIRGPVCGFCCPCRICCQSKFKIYARRGLPLEHHQMSFCGMLLTISPKPSSSISKPAKVASKDSRDSATGSEIQSKIPQGNKTSESNGNDQKGYDQKAVNQSEATTESSNGNAEASPTKSEPDKTKNSANTKKAKPKNESIPKLKKARKLGSLPDVQVGEIKEDWGDDLCARVFCPNGAGRNFGACFPRDCSVQLKATILGAIVLINFLHFDKDPCSPTQFCC